MIASAAALAAPPTATAATYNDKVVRQFAIMTVAWGIVGMAVGVLIAAQLYWPELNLGSWLSYGRLRPLHTNAVIFAFGGCALFATSYHVVQRTCHARLISDKLAAFTFWGWQAVIVLAAITLPAGMTMRSTGFDGVVDRLTIVAGSGLIGSGSGEPGTLRVCDSRGPKNMGALNISGAGQVRFAVDTNGDGYVEDTGPAELTSCT